MTDEVITDYYVDCCNPDCGWKGTESQCASAGILARDWPTCPLCGAVVELADDVTPPVGES